MGQVSFGSVDALKSTVTDQNGTSGIQIGNSTPITDMAANEEVTVKEDTSMLTDTTSANSISKNSYLY